MWFDQAAVTLHSTTTQSAPSFHSHPTFLFLPLLLQLFQFFSIYLSFLFFSFLDIIHQSALNVLIGETVLTAMRALFVCFPRRLGARRRERKFPTDRQQKPSEELTLVRYQVMSSV